MRPKGGTLPKLVGDLQVEQDVKFEKKEWYAQRIGRGLMALIVIGALLGFFGAGPLSLTELHDDTGNLSVIYEHFGRRGATTNLTFQTAPAAVSNGEAHLWISSEYLERMQVDAITPSPDQVAARDGGYLYTFLVGEPDDGLTVTYNFTIDSMGSVTGHAGLAGEEPVELEHFFTP